MKKIAVFASGAGTNAANIIRYFKKNNSINVSIIISNKQDAGVLNIAAENNIPTLVIDREKFFGDNTYVYELKAAGIDLIVLAGFLWKVPCTLIEAYRNKIINIHPALLPKYGGKGMYGLQVHQAVINNKETESGITIHYVDEHYDNGDIIFQASCPVLENDTASSLASRVQLLEHEHYPIVIENLLQ